VPSGSYLLEAYMPKTCAGDAPAVIARARAAAEQMTREGMAVRLVRSFFLPEDELCFCVFEAASAAEVTEAGRRAAMSVGRIQPAVEVAQADVTPPQRSAELADQSAAGRGIPKGQHEEER
jgi:hypothetical protein